MKFHIVVLSSLLMCLPSCRAYKPEAPEDESTAKIVSYTYSARGSTYKPMAYVCVEKVDGRVLLTLQDKQFRERTFVVDEAVLDSVTHIFRQNKMHKYDDHYKSAMQVLDGTSWGMEAKFADGKYKSSGGYHAWPRNDGLSAMEEYLMSLVDKGYKEIVLGMPEDGSNKMMALDCAMRDSTTARICLEVTPDGLVAGEVTHLGEKYMALGTWDVTMKMRQYNIDVFRKDGTRYAYITMSDDYGLEGTWHYSNSKYHSLNPVEDKSYTQKTNFFAPATKPSGTYAMVVNEGSWGDKDKELVLNVNGTDATLYAKGTSERGKVEVDGSAEYKDGTLSYISPTIPENGENYRYSLTGKVYKDFIYVVETNSWHNFSVGEMLNGFYIKVK